MSSIKQFISLKYKSGIFLRGTFHDFSRMTFQNSYLLVSCLVHYYRLMVSVMGDILALAL